MFLQDVRYALRSLWHSRGFAVVAILCLGFGIGLNTTIFSIVDGVLLKPFPYQDPEHIVVPGVRNQQLGVENSSLSYLDFRDWQATSTSFETLAAVQGRSLTIADSGGDPERFGGGMITANLFPLLGVQPIAGRGFSADDDRPGAGKVVLLSYAVWKVRYYSDPKVIGRQVLINAVPAVVIGVMPEHFEFPNNQKLWIPLVPSVSQDPRNARGLFTFGRLKPGVTMAQAESELSGIAGRLATAYPETNKGWTPRIRTLREAFIPANVDQVIWLMMAAATLVLLIACSNVANLLLARASGRRREITVRSALGAARGRIVRQLLTESIVLSLVSVPLGILLAEFGTRLIASDMPPDAVPYYITWQVDWRSLSYTAAVAVVTAVAFGMFPALTASRGNLHETLKEGTRGNSVRRSLLRSALVVVQVSLALVSLVGALLFVRTFHNLDSYNFGFDVKPLMTMRFYLPGEAYEAPDAKLRRAQDIVDRVEALPGVEAAFASNLVPLGGGGGGGSVVVEGRTPPASGQREGITFVGVTPHLFKTVGLSRIRGRDFTDAEGRSRTAVAVISQAMATRFWPDREPLGGRFRVDTGDGSDDAADWFTVIGVAPDFKLFGVNTSNPSGDQPTQVAFVPYAYQQALNTGLTVRVAGDPAAITSAVRAEIRAADPNLPMFQARTMDENRRLNYWQYGLYGWIFGTIGVVGLLLASVGVYGVLSYSVSQRTQEIGVRMALGADRRRVLSLIVSNGVWLCGIGVIAGLVLAFPAMWAAQSQFFNVSPFDPLTFSGVAALLMTVALVASYVPARRATQVNPVEALRGE
jgi:predicted permease